MLGVGAYTPPNPCTPRPPTRTIPRARGVFISVQNFSRGIFLRESLSKVGAAAAPKEDFLEVLTWNRDGKLAAAAATLDSDSLRKIPRARARARNRARNPTQPTAAWRARCARCVPH